MPLKTRRNLITCFLILKTRRSAKHLLVLYRRANLVDCFAHRKRINFLDSRKHSNFLVFDYYSVRDHHGIHCVRQSTKPNQVCKAYTGSPKPAACTAPLSSEVEAAPATAALPAPRSPYAYTSLLTPATDIATV